MKTSSSVRRVVCHTLAATSALSALLVGSGCATAPTSTGPLPAVASEAPQQVLQAGDVIKLSFPGTPTMDTTQQIRRDGKLNLQIIGEIQAAGKSPADFEKELVSLYATQLVSKEVKVTVVSSSFSVFVSGAVLRPGKILPDHTLTVLEAIMEAGGFDFAKANTRGVVVIRNQGGKAQRFTLDLQAVFDGKEANTFYLQANDIIYVPEKFQWF